MRAALCAFTRRVLALALVVGCAAGTACDNSPPALLEVTLVSDTPIESGPYDVRVVAADDDGLDDGTIEWRGQAGAPGALLTQKGTAALRVIQRGARGVDGQALAGAIPGQDFGSEVVWSVVVCDRRGACARSPSYRFVVGARPSAPRITTISPREGPESGGTRVEVRGADFRTGAQVFFGSEPAAHTERIDATLLLATTPPHEARSVAVRARNPDGRDAEAEEPFTFLPSPRLVAVAPTSGPSSGGTAVVVTGERLVDGVRVTFDGAPCRSLVHVSDNELRCETPPGAPGPADVEVRHDERGASRIVAGFTYIAAPLVDGVAPPAGPDTGGTAVVIVGSGFSDGAAVFIDGAPCTDAVVLSPMEIACVTPAGDAGVGDVAVVNPDGQLGVLLGGFDYEGPPVVVAVVPGEGPLVGGIEARVLGAGFRTTDVVRIGGVDAVVIESVGDGELRVLVPPAPTDGTAPDGGEILGDVEVQRQDPNDARSGVLTNGFVWFWPPIVDGVLPDRGPTAGGTAVVVTGRFFRVVQGSALVVLFDGVACTDVVRLSSEAIACTTPAGEAGPADVDVSNHPLSMGTGAGVFTYVPPPRVDSVDPREGPTFGGERVTVRGAGFQTGALVFIDGAPCVDVAVASDVELSCVTPAGEEGLADVRVVNPDGQQDTAESAYAYLGVAVTPDHGTPAGFTRVRVRSAGIASGAAVRFDGVVADCVFVSSREMSCQSPPHAPGPVTVSFTNPDGTGEDGEDAFAYRVFVDRSAGRIDGVGNNANHAETADVDADGDLDVVVAMGAVGIPQQSFLFRNDGAADFAREALLEATANKVDFGDFNADGRPDAVFGATSGSGAHLLRNVNGSFVLDEDVSASRGAFDALLADLVGDARDDVFVLTIGCDPFLDQEEQPNCDSVNDGLDVLLESTADGFIDRSALVPQEEAWTHDHKMVATDVDGDLDLDLVIVVNNDPYITSQNRVLVNRVDEGEGFVAELQPDLLNLVGDLYDIVAGDLDGDGDEDIVTTICAQPSGSGEAILENIGGELVRNIEALPNATEDCDVGTLAHDVDADGDLDLFFGGTRAARYNLKLYINRGDGTFVDGASALPDVGTPRLQVNHLTGGDFDGDGDADVVLAAGAPYETPGEPGATLLFLLE